MCNKIKSNFKVIHYFIRQHHNTCHFDSQMQQFNRNCGLPTLARLAAASRRAAYQQLIQLNWAVHCEIQNICICASDKYYLRKQCITLKSNLILLNTFWNQIYISAGFNGETSKMILFSKINQFLRSTA